MEIVFNMTARSRPVNITIRRQLPKIVNLRWVETNISLRSRADWLQMFQHLKPNMSRYLLAAWRKRSYSHWWARASVSGSRSTKRFMSNIEPRNWGKRGEKSTNNQYPYRLPVPALDCRVHTYLVQLRYQREVVIVVRAQTVVPASWKRRQETTNSYVTLQLRARSVRPGQ